MKHFQTFNCVPLFLIKVKEQRMGNTYSERCVCRCNAVKGGEVMFSKNSKITAIDLKSENDFKSQAGDRKFQNTGASASSTVHAHSLEKVTSSKVVTPKGEGRRQSNPLAFPKKLSSRSRSLSERSAVEAALENRSGTDAQQHDKHCDIQGGGRGRGLRRKCNSSSGASLERAFLSGFENLSLEVGNQEKKLGQKVFLDGMSSSVAEEDVEIPKHVLYYGWFIAPAASAAIRSVVMNVYQTCFDQISQFERYMTTCCSDKDVRGTTIKLLPHLFHPFEYYKRMKKRDKPDDNPTYHVTAKFLGRNPHMDYQTAVQPFLKKVFHIHLVGLVFTPRTLGVRVKLTPAEKLIFQSSDDLQMDNDAVYRSTTFFQTIIDKELSSYDKSFHKKKSPNCKFKSPSEDDIYFLDPSPTSASNAGPVTTNKAHITIGCAPKILNMQTGLDLLDIIDLEGRPASNSHNFQQDFKTELGTLRQFGRHANAFVFYPNAEMIVPGKFDAFI